MRKVAVIALVVMASVVLAASVMAESAIKDECVALCKDAAKFINEKGLDAGMAEINNKEGKFVTKNTYVFLWFKTNFPKAARHRPQIDPNRSLENLIGRPQPVTICGSIKLGLNARTGRTI